MKKILRFIIMFSLVYIAINFNSKVYADYYQMVEWSIPDAGGEYVHPQDDPKNYVYFNYLKMLKADGIELNGNTLKLNLYIDDFENRVKIVDYTVQTKYSIRYIERLSTGAVGKIKVYDDLGLVGETTFNNFTEGDEYNNLSTYIPFDFKSNLSIMLNRQISGELKLSLDYTWSGYGQEQYNDPDSGYQWDVITGIMTASSSTPMIAIKTKSDIKDTRILDYLTNRIQYSNKLYAPASHFIVPTYINKFSRNKYEIHIITNRLSKPFCL